MKHNNEISVDEYQSIAIKTAIYPNTHKIVYPMIGLSGEVGEVAEKIKKTIRDNNGQFDDDRKIQIAYEIGDVLWYCANLANDLELSLSDIVQMNINKITTRSCGNKIHGSGDNR